MANVNTEQMARYLAVFHDEFADSVTRYVPSEHRPRLLRNSLLPASIVGFVSTQFGAGYEYQEGDALIVVERGSQRIEDLLVRAPSRLRTTGPMIAVGGSNSGIAKLTLEGAFPFRLTQESADVLLHDVGFKAAGWHQIVRYAHIFGNRRADFWTESQAVRRAKDEVLAALFDIQQSRDRDVDLGTYLAEFKQQTVLLLGDFNRGRARLDAIRALLREVGYRAVLLDEIPEEPHYALAQKFQAVAAVCRFLIFEDSTPAGQIAEMYLARDLDAVRVVLREEGSQSSFMTRGMGLTSSTLREWDYTSETLPGVLSDATAWAEGLLPELAEARKKTYPWRADDH